MKGIEVVRTGELTKGTTTQGIAREKAFETEDAVIARSRVAGGVVSGWHHHGTRDLYGFIVSGRLRVEQGERGTEFVEVGAGDFFHISIGLVHRDVNPDPRQEAVVVNILFGKGPTAVNVQGPGD